MVGYWPSTTCIQRRIVESGIDTIEFSTGPQFVRSCSISRETVMSFMQAALYSTCSTQQLVQHIVWERRVGITDFLTYYQVQRL